MKYKIIGLIISDDEANNKIKDIVKNNDGLLIDFYSNKMEDLIIIAKHRLLPVPTVLAINSNDKVIVRLVENIPTTQKFKEILNKVDNMMEI